MTRRFWSICLISLLAILAKPGRAREPAGPATPQAVEQAKAEFHRGLDQLEAGDVEGALASFLNSRRTVPTAKNTANAAICLEHLGRLDEALELYQELAERFEAELDADDRARLAPAIAALRRRTAGLVVTSNVSAQLFVNGKLRAQLPHQAPVPVLPGRQTLRVLAPGHVPFERQVVTEAEQTVVIDARLDPKPDLAGLNIVEVGRSGGNLFIDGRRVGTTPWRGLVPPGTHRVWIESGQYGTAPRLVEAIGGRWIQVPLRSEKLGPQLALSVHPESAVLRIDGVSTNESTWTGRLPIGRHEVDADAPGFEPARNVLEIRDDTEPIRLEIRLSDARPFVTPEPAASPPRDGYYGTLSASYAVGPGLASDAEIDCPESCSTDPQTSGWLLTAHGGLTLKHGLRLEVAAGYARFASEFSRAVPALANSAYRLDDALLLHGPILAAGAGYGVTVADRLEVITRLSFGGMLALASDHLAGELRDASTWTRLDFESSGRTAIGLDLLLWPELAIARRFGALELRLGVGMVYVLTQGPMLDHGAVSCGPRVQAATICSEASLDTEERSHGRFWVLTPSLQLAYVF